MGQYHVLKSDANGNRFDVVMHFEVPDIENQVGRNYREVLMESLGGSQNSRVPFIAGTEQTLLSAGELLEHTVQFNSNPQQSLPQKLVRLDDIWNTERTTVLSRLAAELSYWGYSRA